MEERKALARDNALPASVLMEVSKTYTDIAEKITGQKLPVCQNPREEIIEILDKQFGLIDRSQAPKGGSVAIFAGSDSDMPHLESIKKELAKFKIPAQIRICSAHKQPARLEAILKEYNRCMEPMLIVGCAGGTDALSGTASYISKHPVISCPPDGMNNTCLTNPPGSSNAFICKPSNVAKFAAQYFAHCNPEVAAALDLSIADKIRKLEQADEQLLKKARTA